MVKVKKKATVGLTKRDSNQDFWDDPSKDERPAEPVLRLAEQAKGARNVVGVYLGLALMVATLWDALHITLEVPQRAAVWVSLYNNGSTTSTRCSAYQEERVAAGLEELPCLEEQPQSLRVKLLAIYLAEDVNATTLQPLYGARRSDTKADTGAGEIIPEVQRARRVWTHASCDPDGDGYINDCDVSAGWKYRWLQRDWIDLAAETPDPYTPRRHEVPAGQYRFVVLQTCLENLDNASMYAVFGGDMTSLHTWRRAAPRHGGSCFVLARPLDSPLVLAHGDDTLLLLTYDLAGTFRTKRTGDESEPEWECFEAATVPERLEYCARMPALQPTWIKRSEASNVTSYAGDDWFTLVQAVSNRIGYFSFRVDSPPPPPPPPEAPSSPPPEASPSPPSDPPATPQ